MSFVDQKRGPSAAGLASAIAVQAAIGIVIVTGLTVAGHTIEDGPIIDTWDIKDPPPPEPEPTPETKPEAQPDASTMPPINVPQPKLPLDTTPTEVKTTETIYDGPIILEPRPTVDKAPPPPAPVATFDPVGAKPRNDPGTWVQDRDYKSAWARRELAGVASFRLDISATGKVTGCRITGSTGHSELDAATCQLIEKRARFEPARGRNGEPLAGSYSSAVRWELPE